MKHLQQVQDHGIVIALGTVPPHERDTDATSERFVNLGLVFKLRVLCFDRLEFDGNLFTGNDIDTEVNVTYTLVLFRHWCVKQSRSL